MNSVAPWVVFDTNALWNFAAVQRIHILETRYGARAIWTESVEREVQLHVYQEPELALLKTGDWLGAPRSLAETACLDDVLRLQRALASPGDPPSKHLGEAECMHYIQHELHGDALFVTDDGAAADMAQRRGVRVLDTAAVLAECLSNFELVCPQPYELLCAMADANRGVRVPAHHTAICP